MGRTFDRDELIRLASARLGIVRQLRGDPLDSAETIAQLRDEFGAGVVAQAIRRLKRSEETDLRQSFPGGPHPLWDRELDG